MDQPACDLELILAVSVYDLARETELSPAPRLSRRLGHQVLLKREDQQPTFSFKLRGAHARIKTLSDAERSRGVIAASAGNHAQGVALSARHLGIGATIVMPRTTPSIKVEAVRDLGADIRLHGDGYDAASELASELAEQTGACLIHPFDDPQVIAGQGTIGLEIIRQCRETPHAVFVPVGGGGLIAGVALAIKSLSPETRIIGVEPSDAASFKAALACGRRVTLEQVGHFADGASVACIGAHPFQLARGLVDDVITVDADEICAAMRDIFEDTRTMVEPAGALAVAGLKRHVGPPGQRLVAINSGANVNFDRLGHVVERAIYGQGEEALLSATIPERAGSFLRFCRDLGRVSITEFNYRYASSDQARVFVGVRLGAPGERTEVVTRLQHRGYPVTDLTNNPLARSHIRHLVGGCLPCIRREVLVRFEFPERPGALLDFLTALAGRWNISLFHYRNHGAAYGRVLAGLMVAESEQREFTRFLNETGYPWLDESDNPAYRQFLATPDSLGARLKVI
jgi:threonine dehydratase